MATQIGTANLAEYFSSDAYVKRPVKGFVTTLGQEMPELKYGATNFFDLSSDTEGKFVGESEAKDGDDASTPLRQIRTEKIVYDHRISVEAYNQLMESGGLEAYIANLTAKFLGRDFQRDLDRLALHGKIKAAGTHTMQDYITAKDGSKVLTPVISATADTAEAIDKAISQAVTECDADAVALNNVAASKLATVMNGSVRKYPGLSAFGAGSDLGGLAAISTKNVGGDDVIAVAGDFSAIRWGIVAEAPVMMLDAGNPDGKGDLGNRNEYLIRLELFFGLGIANHDALRVVKSKAA